MSGVLKTIVAAMQVTSKVFFDISIGGKTAGANVLAAFDQLTLV
jgi:hypothetical protein